jgi:deoxyribose-phosphate aldolase
MRKYADAHIQVKAAGGVRSYEDILKVRELGVTRIGATATKTIVEAVRGNTEDKTAGPEGY